MRRALHIRIKASKIKDRRLKKQGVDKKIYLKTPNRKKLQSKRHKLHSKLIRIKRHRNKRNNL